MLLPMACQVTPATQANGVSAAAVSRISSVASLDSCECRPRSPALADEDTLLLVRTRGGGEEARRLRTPSPLTPSPSKRQAETSTPNEIASSSPDEVVSRHAKLAKKRSSSSLSQQQCCDGCGITLPSRQTTCHQCWFQKWEAIANMGNFAAKLRVNSSTAQ